MRRSEAEGSRAGEAERTSEAKWPQGAACEDKADAQQATRLKAARHFPQIHKHCIRNPASLKPSPLFVPGVRLGRYCPRTEQHSIRQGNPTSLTHPAFPQIRKHCIRHPSYKLHGQSQCRWTKQQKGRVSQPFCLIPSCSPHQKSSRTASSMPSTSTTLSCVMGAVSSAAKAGGGLSSTSAPKAR